MFQKSLIALALAGTVVLAGCGGGGGDSAGSGTPSPTARNDVSGPLDPVQGSVSEQVLAPLATAAAGTPLQGVVTCVDQIVVSDTLDVVDFLSAQVDANALNPATSATVVQAELTNLIADLQGLLTSLAGGTGACGATIPAPGGSTTNPLAGTPLAPFGDQLLATLGEVQGQLSAGGSGTPSLATLSGLITQLSAGYATALAMLPTEATAAPVLGPSLSLIGTALSDLNTTVAQASAMNATGTATAITNTVTHLLDGLLLGVLPIGELEAASGTDGALSGPIADALAQLTAALAGGFAAPGSDLGGTALTQELTDLLAPLMEPTAGGGPDVLTTLLAQINAVLPAGSTGALPVPDVGPLALDNALAQLSTLLGTAGTAGGPLDPLISTLTDLLGMLGL